MKVGTVKRFSTLRSPPETTSMAILCSCPDTETRMRSARPMSSGTLPSTLTVIASADLNSRPSRVTALVSMSRVCALPM
jgi:hypothetical protein